MNRKLILLTSALSLIIIFFVYTDIKYLDDVSNESLITEVQFVRLTEAVQNSSPVTLPQNDYNKLIDIKFEFKLLPLVCQKVSPFLLILVHSAPQNIEKRETIRATWGRKHRDVKLLFMLGTTNSNESEWIVELKKELQSSNDIVEGSFIDSYRNLTYKHVMALKYATYHCPNAKYILKTDDDIFVDTPSLLNYIVSEVSPHGAERLLMCNIWYNAVVRRSYRSKYRFSFKEYPKRTFPPYCSGWFILYSPDVVLDLYLEAQHTTYFWIDDVYITGMLASNLKIPHFNLRKLVISKNKMNEISKGYCGEDQEDFILGRPNLNTLAMRKLWSCVRST